jgi:hypothetical protein
MLRFLRQLHSLVLPTQSLDKLQQRIALSTHKLAS